MKVKVYNESNNPLPKYATKRSAGMDIQAFITNNTKVKGQDSFIQDGEITIHAGGWALIPTGLSMVIPDNYEIQIRPKSGNSLKKGLIVLNSPGTIDADYTFEIGVIAWNVSKEDIIIKSGDYIAQIVLNRIPQIEFVSITQEDLIAKRDNVNRIGGFGSSNKNVNWFFIDSKEIQGCSGSFDKPCITVFLKGGNKLIIPELDEEILDYLLTAKYDYPEGCYISSGGGVEKYTTILKKKK